MSIKATIKARSAAKKMSEGKTDEALKLYEEAIADGLTDPRFILSYTVLLIRKGEFAKAREILVKNQKNPYLNADTKRQLFVNYAACVFKMGELQKGVDLLERQHQKEPSGLVYETLGYLYVEAGDFEKAKAYNLEALDYDDEDPISLDNLGQTYYRLGNDKVKAKEYFDKAHELKPSQIDTLYFLSQYDIEAGDKDAAKAKLETALEGNFSPLNYATKELIAQTLRQLD